MDTEPALLYSRTGPVATIVFNRPAALNAIDEEIAQRFIGACETIVRDPEVRVVVLRGAGRGFVAGGDLRMLAEAPEEVAPRLIDPMHRGLSMLHAHDVPLIAAVHGSAAGAGLSLVLASDLAVAARGSRFSMAYLRVGASSDLGASWTLPRVVGPRKAMELALLNPTFDADEALRLGILNAVVDAEALDAHVQDLAARIARMPAPALGRMTRLLRDAHARDFDGQLRAERDAFHACATHDGFAAHAGTLLNARPARAQDMRPPAGQDEGTA